jgi:hypothetical protein
MYVAPVLCTAVYCRTVCEGLGTWVSPTPQQTDGKGQTDRGSDNRSSPFLLYSPFHTGKMKEVQLVHSLSPLICRTKLTTGFQGFIYVNIYYGIPISWIIMLKQHIDIYYAVKYCEILCNIVSIEIYCVHTNIYCVILCAYEYIV